MSAERWKPSVTVAVVAERDGRYLLVEEHTPEGLRLNNPAGHLDEGESLEQAVVRECLEETACRFTPEALVGVYLSRFERPAKGDRPAEGVTYLRFAYCGAVSEPEPGRALDDGIVRTLWLTLDEVRAAADRLRSPLVITTLEQHAAGLRHPLSVAQADASVWSPRRLGS